MQITRREILKTAVLGTGAALLQSASTLPILGQSEDRITTQIRSDLEKHASFGQKFSGGPGDLATADWIAGRLKDSGYRVRQLEFDAPFFVKRSARLVMGSATAEVFPQPLVLPTGATGITAPLVAVENQVSNVQGSIALVIAPSARHAALGAGGVGQTVKNAAAAGARAIVIVTTGPTGEAIALNVPEEGFVSVPTAILAPKNAEPFVNAARSGAQATLILDGEATKRPSRNVIAELNRGDRWIGLSTPRTGWFDCVGERGTGTAVFLELASWMARSFPDLSVFVMNSGGHEYFFAGSHRVLDLAPDPKKTLVWAHIGASVAARDASEAGGKLTMLDTADPQRSLMTTDAARAAATTAFQGLSGLERPTPVRAGAGELSTFTDRGYSAAFAVLGIHRWFHTVKDTIECTDARLVTPVLQAHQRTIELLLAKR